MKLMSRYSLFFYSSLVIMLFIIQCNCFGDKSASLELLQTNLREKNVQGALAQLKTLIAAYPEDAISFIIDDQNKKLWGSSISDAILVLKQASESLSSDNFILQTALFDCYKNQKDWDNAFQLIDQMMLQHPDKKCACHNFRAISYYYQGKDYDAALSEVRKAADSYNGPDDEKVLLKSILSCYKSNNAVIRAAYAIIRHSPGSTDFKKGGLFSWAGQICRNGGCYKEAIQVYKKAMQLYAGYDQSKKRNMVGNIINCYKDAGLDKDAAAFAKSVDHDDVVATEKQQLAHFYLDSKMYESAIPICKEILSISDCGSYAVDALTVLAECMYSLDRGKEADDFQNQYFAAHPGNEIAAAWVKARTSFYAAFDFKKADQEIAKFIKDYPSSEYINSAKELYVYNSLWRINNVDQAREICEELAAGSDSAEIHFYLGYCKYKKQDYKSAMKDFQYVCNNHPTANYAMSALYMTGDCYQKLDDVDSAITTFETVVSKYPESKSSANAKRRITELQKTDEDGQDQSEEGDKI
jgi:tetratricopeptide (TPR) repeat protein